MGDSIGNQIEIEETIECLHGNLRPDIEELVTKYGGYLLQRTKRVNTMTEGAKLILEKLKNGEALAKFKEMLIGQGVNEYVAHALCYDKKYNTVFDKQAQFVSNIKAFKSGNFKDWILRF